MLLTTEQLKELAFSAVNDMNNIPYCRDVIFKCGQAGMLQKAIEIGILDKHKELYPFHEAYHPADTLKMPDVYSDKYNDGYEIKVTTGWKWNGEEHSVRWTNGTIQDSTENFIFLKVATDKDNNNQCIVEEMWIGRISYKQWKIKKCDNSMYISKKTVNRLCEKLI